jgi:aspartate aminotransferase
MNGDQQCVNDMLKAFTRRKELIMKLLKDVPNIQVSNPGGAFYVFPKVDYYFGKSFNGKKINNADELCLYLLTEGHIATVAGSAFGEPTCIRISFATSDDKITEAVKRFKEALGKLD